MVLLFWWQYTEYTAAPSCSCTLQSEATSLLLTAPILPALHPAATTASNAPTALTFLPADRCHVTVNLHCTYVTFYKLHCPCAQVINTGRGNWMLIGETIDQSPEKTVGSDLMIHLILLSRRVGGGRQSPCDSKHSSSLWPVVCERRGSCHPGWMSFCDASWE